ncbi:CLUMA_CG000629, isoform A [Clunio marinus]|uniref:CLUMA_CG000629, isoform A n=1 Tax=Clunio marinus TaxID=568069 RepID=A0A1J1HK01_9DIPT|nr:CLUMA_CG000629, isoform A [Clunio marinus]
MGKEFECGYGAVNPKTLMSGKDQENDFLEKSIHHHSQPTTHLELHPKHKKVHSETAHVPHVFGGNNLKQSRDQTCFVLHVQQDSVMNRKKIMLMAVQSENRIEYKKINFVLNLLQMGFSSVKKRTRIIKT